MHIDALARLRIELRHLETGRTQASAIQPPPPPDAVQMPTRLPARQALAPGEEARGDIDHLTDVAALDHPVALEHGR